MKNKNLFFCFCILVTAWSSPSFADNFCHNVNISELGKRGRWEIFLGTKRNRWGYDDSDLGRSLGYYSEAPFLIVDRVGSQNLPFFELYDITQQKVVAKIDLKYKPTGALYRKYFRVLSSPSNPKEFYVFTLWHGGTSYTRELTKINIESLSSASVSGVKNNEVIKWEWNLDELLLPIAIDEGKYILHSSENWERGHSIALTDIDFNTISSTSTLTRTKPTRPGWCDFYEFSEIRPDAFEPSLAYNVSLYNCSLAREYYQYDLSNILQFMKSFEGRNNYVYIPKVISNGEPKFSSRKCPE